MFTQIEAVSKLGRSGLEYKKKKITFFGLKKGKAFEERAAHPN